MFTRANLWVSGADTGGALPPKPHMYQADGYGHRAGPGRTGGRDLFFNKDFTTVPGGLTIVGGAHEHIRNIVGIPDFNSDSRDDLAIGAPEADILGSGQSDGAVYIVFRRARSLEGDYVLEKLAYAPSHAERLSGVLITGDAGAGEGFGDVVVSGLNPLLAERNASGEFEPAGMDFNSTGVPDVIIGNARGNGGKGEVFIVFDDKLLQTPENGTPIETLMKQHKAARLTGVDNNSLFGFSVAVIGDVNGDGMMDLAIAAPTATPKFDSDPFDTINKLDTEGVDMDLDGKKDDVSGPLGLPDEVVDSRDSLPHAGLVYVVYGGLDARTWAEKEEDNYEISIAKLGTKELPGFIVIGRRSSDQLAGGFAASLTTGHPFFGLATGGIASKRKGDFGRSYGLAGVGDVDGDGLADLMVGSIMADPRIDPKTGEGTHNGGEAYLIYGFEN